MVDRRITGRMARPPDSPINLQDAVEQLVIAMYGPGFVAEFPRAVLNDASALEIEGHRRAAAWDAARARILEWFQVGDLTLFRVSKRNPLEALAVVTDFWQSSDHDYVVLQRSLLDRNEDDSGHYIYIVDRAVLQRRLDDLPGAAQDLKHPPIQSEKERRAKLEELARQEWGESLERMPSREKLQSWARNNVARNVNRADIRWLRSRGPVNIRKGGAGMHRRKRCT
jgi:hypothetical protein